MPGQQAFLVHTVLLVMPAFLKQLFVPVLPSGRRVACRVGVWGHGVRRGACWLACGLHSERFLFVTSAAVFSWCSRVHAVVGSIGLLWLAVYGNLGPTASFLVRLAGAVHGCGMGLLSLGVILFLYLGIQVNHADLAGFVGR